MTIIAFIAATAAVWASAGALATDTRDRGRARLGMLSGTLGALAGWALLGSIGGMLVLSGGTSLAALQLTYLSRRRRATAYPLRERPQAPAVERLAS